MDSDNRVVGFAMCLHKDGKGKEIVIAAPPELQSQCEAAMEREPEELTSEEVCELLPDLVEITDVVRGVPSEIKTATEMQGKKPRGNPFK